MTPLLLILSDNVSEIHTSAFVEKKWLIQKKQSSILWHQNEKYFSNTSYDHKNMHSFKTIIKYSKFKYAGQQ